MPDTIDERALNSAAAGLNGIRVPDSKAGSISVVAAEENLRLLLSSCKLIEGLELSGITVEGLLEGQVNRGVVFRLASSLIVHRIQLANPAPASLTDPQAGVATALIFNVIAAGLLKGIPDILSVVEADAQCNGSPTAEAEMEPSYPALQLIHWMRQKLSIIAPVPADESPSLLSNGAAGANASLSDRNSKVKRGLKGKTPPSFSSEEAEAWTASSSRAFFAAKVGPLGRH